MTEAGHMPWCQGEHDTGGDCCISMQWAEMGTLTLAGAPCSHVELEIDPQTLTEAAHLDQLVAALQQMRPALEAGQTYANLHDHADDDADEAEGDEAGDDDEWEPPTACERCGNDGGGEGVDTYLVPNHGYVDANCWRELTGQEPPR